MMADQIEQRGELDAMFESAEWVQPNVEVLEVPAVPAGEVVVPEVEGVSLEVTPVVPAVPGVDAQVVETPLTPEQINVELRAQLLALTAQLGQTTQQIYPPAQPAAQTQPSNEPVKEVMTPVVPAVPEQTAFVPGTYLTDEELDKVIDDPRLIVTAIQRAQQDMMKQMELRLAPQQSQIAQIVQQQVAQQIAVTKALTDFYDGNTDLRPYAQFTQYVMGEVEKKHLGSGKTYSEIFEETAKEARKRLGLPNPAVQTIERGKVVEQRPAFAGTKKGGNARPTTIDQVMFSKDAADMLALED